MEPFVVCLPQRTSRKRPVRGRQVHRHAAATDGQVRRSADPPGAAAAQLADRHGVALRRGGDIEQVDYLLARRLLDVAIDAPSATSLTRSPDRGRGGRRAGQQSGSATA